MCTNDLNVDSFWKTIQFFLFEIIHYSRRIRNWYLIQSYFLFCFLSIFCGFVFKCFEEPFTATEALGRLCMNERCYGRILGNICRKILNSQILTWIQICLIPAVSTPRDVINLSIPRNKDDENHSTIQHILNLSMPGDHQVGGAQLIKRYLLNVDSVELILA